MPFRIVSLSLLACIIVSGCRIAKVGKDYPSDETNGTGAADAKGKAPAIQPQRQPNVTGAVQAIPVTLDQTGTLVGRVQLRLDYFAPPKPGGVTVPSCYEGISGHLVIAKVECGSDVTLKTDVRADQMDQVCFTESTTPRVQAKKPIQVVHCSGPSTLQVFSFSPEMKVEVKRQDDDKE